MPSPSFDDAIVVRIVLCLLLWSIPLALLMSLIVQNAKDYGRAMTLQIIGGFWCCLLITLVVGLFLARQIREAEVLAISRNVIFQMDLDRIVETVTNFWRVSSNMTLHPLQPLLFQPLTYVVVQLTGVSLFRAAQAACAFSVSLAVATLSVALFHLLRRPLPTALACAGVLTTFGVWLLLMFPESSALATFGVILPYTVLLLRSGKQLTWQEFLLYLLAGVQASGVTITAGVNALICFYARSMETHRVINRSLLGSLVLFVGAMAGSVLALSFATTLLYAGTGPYLSVWDIAGRGSYLATWWDGIMHPLRVVLQMLVYPVFCPGFVLSDLGAVTESFPWFQISAESLGLKHVSVERGLMIVAFLVVSVYVVHYHLQTAIYRAFAYGLIFHVALHLVYSNELLLFVGYWLMLWWLMLCNSLRHSRRMVLYLIVILITALYNNQQALNELFRLQQQARDVATLKIPIGNPGHHEFQRTFINSLGQVSVGVGSPGLLVIAYDVSARENTLSSLLKQAQGVQYKLHPPEAPAPVVVSTTPNLKMQQRVVAHHWGSLIHIRLEPRSRSAGKQSTNYHLYLLLTNFGPASSAAKRSFQLDSSSKTVLCDGVPLLQVPMAPDFVLQDSKSWRIFRTAYRGDTQIHLSMSDWLRIVGTGIRPGEGDASILLGWKRSIKEPLELWVKCFYTSRPLNMSGEPLTLQEGNAADYQPLSGIPDDILHEEPRKLVAETLAFWRGRQKHYSLYLPDPRWSEAFWGIMAHLSTNVQQSGRMPVAPINYGVFTRDAAYMLYALLATGQPEYAREALEYLLQHPWSGRPYPEGDTPAHLLWSLHKYWLFTQDKRWLREKLPVVRDLAQAVLDMRSDGRAAKRVNLLGQEREIDANIQCAQRYQKLSGRDRPFFINYGQMDQTGELYVNILSLWALRGAVEMLQSGGDALSARRVGQELKGYIKEVRDLLAGIGYRLDDDLRGQYAALWPARLQELVPEAESYYQHLRYSPTQEASPWRYFDTDLAHNMLHSGHREAGYRVVERYLRVPKFSYWKILDEGGLSSQGYWGQLNDSCWHPAVAVPHGWSLASLGLLLRDCLAYETSTRLVLLAGVPPEWFAPNKRIEIVIPTEYGDLHLRVIGETDGVLVHASVPREPRDGVWFRLPEGFEQAEVRIPIGRNVRFRRTD